MIQIMRLATQKHLLMSSKTNKLIKEKEMREKVEMREKLEKELKDKNKELKI